MYHTTSFRSMNTDVAAWLWHTNAWMAREALNEVRRAFGEAHARFSRFEPASELSALNAASGRPFAASPELFEVVEQALALCEQTGGLFNPAIIDALEAAGYDRTFEAIQHADDSHAISPARPAPTPFVALNTRRRAITMPAGTRLDLGGIAKGWTVQRTAQRLSLFGPCVVDAGGDIMVCGSPPGELAWRVGVADPFDSQRDLIALRLRDRAVATSGIDRRRWTRNGVMQHHLIDPRTGRPADADLMSVTVVAPSVVEAEAYAKAIFLMGSGEGMQFAEAHPWLAPDRGYRGLAAALVTRSGRLLISSRLKDHLDVHFVYDASEILAA